MRRETGVEEMEWCFNYFWQLGTSIPATTELFTLKSSHVNQNFYTWPQGLFFCSTSCAQPQTACGHAPAAARESCALDVNSNSTKLCGKPLTSPCRPPESIGLVCLQPLIMKLDKSTLMDKNVNVRAEMVGCCQMQKSHATIHWVGRRGVRTLCNCS